MQETSTERAYSQAFSKLAAQLSEQASYAGPREERDDCGYVYVDLLQPYWRCEARIALPLFEVLHLMLDLLEQLLERRYATYVRPLNAVARERELAAWQAGADIGRHELRPELTQIKLSLGPGPKHTTIELLGQWEVE